MTVIYGVLRMGQNKQMQDMFQLLLTHDWTEVMGSYSTADIMARDRRMKYIMK